MASMRRRVGLSISSASASSRASRRSRRVASGVASRSSARASRSAAPGRSATVGNRSQSSAKPVVSASAPARASTWRRNSRRTASVGFGLARLDAGEVRARLVGQARASSQVRAARRQPARRRPAWSPTAPARPPDRPAGGAGRGRATARPPHPAASGAVPPSPPPTAPRQRRRPPRRTDDAPRRTRSGSGPSRRRNPPQAACAITSAWFATTRSAPRARRMVCSTKQRFQCGQAAWMHSPRRSASPASRPVPNSSPNQPGRSPPCKSPSARRQRPARDQCQRHRRAHAEAAGGAAHRILQVEQAEVVLPPLAHHDAAATLGGIGVEPGQFLVDLPLQMAGVGADPYRAAVLLCPQAGGRDVAEGLAGAGAGLGEHEVRIAAHLARGKRRRGGAGVVGLAGPLLRVRAEEVGKPGARLGLPDRVGRRWWRRRRLLPFRQMLPDLQRLGRRRGVRLAECRQDERRPRPRRAPTPAQQGSQAGGVAIERDLPPRGQPAQQAGRQRRQHRRLGLQSRRRQVMVERQRQPSRRRGGRPCGQDKSKQLQQVERRQVPQTEPAKGRWGMHDERRRQPTQPLGDGVRRQQQKLAVRRQQRRTPMPRSQRRRSGKRNPDGRRQVGRNRWSPGHRRGRVRNIPDRRSRRAP